MVDKSNFSTKARRDILLVNRAKEGDQEAFTEILGLYREPLYFLLYRMVSHKGDAEDLVIETFEKAFRNIRQYSDNYAFSTWLYKVATNHCIDFLRKKKNKLKPLSIDRNDDLGQDEYYKYIFISDNKPNPEEELILEQKSEILMKLIKKLPPNYRRVLVLRYYEDYSYAEIAEELDVPLGTIKARLHRSRELLSGIIEEHNDAGKFN
ncbi:MAG: sigma-70 family RNA polymerase sigma factor [Bacteroidota bacterium]|nr:sigma-70 family RNA polymerase sigma factor [Bacteroidota bacterium]